MDKELLIGMVNGFIASVAGLSFIRYVWPRNEKKPLWKIILLIIALAIVIGLLLGLFEKVVLNKSL